MRAPTDLRLPDRPDDLIESGHRMTGPGQVVWLAGAGALGMMEEPGDALFRDLVSHGEKVERRTDTKRHGSLDDIDRSLRNIGSRQRGFAHSAEEATVQEMFDVRAERNE